MPVPRVHSFLPDHSHGILGYALGEEIEHVPAAWNLVEAAQAAVDDPDCVAFVGPLLSWQVAEVAPMLNEAGISHLAPGATLSGLTRDEPGARDGMPGSLFPTGERTLFRLVPRDTAIARAVVAEYPRAWLVCDESDYGLQIAAQLRMAGLEVDEAADLTVYAGLGPDIPPLPGRVLGFEGAAEEGFPGRLALPQRGGDGWPAEQAILYGPQIKEAGMLIFGSAIAGGPSRLGVLAGLRACGRFDEFGDTRECRVGLWEFAGPVMRQVGVIEDPGP